MSIVQQCTPFSYSLFPPYPLLAAPAPRLMLSAPHINGLICAPVKIIENIVIEQYTVLDLILEEVDLAIEAMDARLDKMWSDARQRQRQRREAVETQLAEKWQQREREYQELLKQ